MSTASTYIAASGPPHIFQNTLVGAIVGGVLFLGCWLLAACFHSVDRNPCADRALHERRDDLINGAA
jgi:hypothetical protein